MTTTISPLSATPAAASKVDAYPLQVGYLGENKEVRGKNVSLDVLQGTKITLALPENSGSSGYQWSVIVDDASEKYLKVVDDERLVPRCPTPGFPQRRFTLEIAEGAPSPLKLSLELARPWGETVPPSVKKDVTFNVFANSKIEPLNARQGIMPGGCIPPSLRNAQHVKALYGNAIMGLPGVNGVGLGAGTLVVNAESKSAAKKLDNLLEDAIDGVPVTIKNVGVIRPQTPAAMTTEAAAEAKAQAEAAQFHLADPGKVLRKYGAAIETLPGVVGVNVEAVRLGPMLPAQQDMLVVRTATPSEIGFLDNLLEDEIEGVPVKFIAVQPNPGPIYRPL